QFAREAVLARPFELWSETVVGEEARPAFVFGVRLRVAAYEVVACPAEAFAAVAVQFGQRFGEAFTVGRRFQPAQFEEFEDQAGPAFVRTDADHRRRAYRTGFR